MIKIIPPNSWNFDSPQVQFMKSASNGLRGNDLSAFIKRAGHTLANWVRENPPLPGEVLIHAIPLGSTEISGPNRNHDGYPHEMLKAAYPTFDKYAYWYRDHCFPAGTLVTAADRIRKPIEQFKVGDKVATKEGPRKVVRTMAQDYDGPGVEIKTVGTMFKTKVTSEHPILVIKRNQLHCSSNYNCLTNGKSRHSKHCTECKELLRELSPEYVPAATIKKGDYVLCPMAKAGTDAVNGDFAELVGWIASEGCVSKAGAIQFTFSTKNTKDITAVKRCLTANGITYIYERERKDGLTALACNKKVLADKIRTYVDGTYSNKTITDKILSWNREGLLRFAGSYVDGDGHVIGEEKGKSAGRLIIRSGSNQMLSMLSDVLLALNVPPIVYIDKKAREETIRGRKCLCSSSGCVSVGAYYSEEVCKYSRKRYRKKNRQPSNLIFDNCVLRKVTDVTNIHINEKVYNLEVEDVHHYLVNEFVVHNCNQDTKKSYGKVRKSWYNEPLQRVESIIALNGNKEAAERNKGLVADKEMEMLESGKEIPVSQSVKVSFDLCSGCGHKAKSRKFYCDETTCKYGGCKNHLGTVYEDGTHLFVENPCKDNKFFDLSNVSRTRGADRTAFVTGKVAYDSNIVGGAELADQLGLTTPAYLISKEANNSLKVLRQLSSMENSVDDEFTPWYVVEETRGKLPELSKYATEEDKYQYLADTAEAGIILPPHVWLSICTDAPREKCAEFWGTSRILSNNLLNNDDVYDILSSNALPEADIATAVKYKSAAPTKSSFEKVAAIKSFTTFKKAQVIGASNDIREVAEQRYLAYQANAIAKQSNSVKFKLMLEDALRHNLNYSWCPVA